MRGFLFLALSLSFTFGAAETVNFDAVRPGTVPPGWTIFPSTARAEPRWQVRLDRSAPSHPNVLAEMIPPGSSREYSLALLDRSACRNGDLSVDLKMVGARPDQAAGIIWRFQNPGNYYFAVASVGKHAVGIYKKENSEVSLVAHASVPHLVNNREWNLLKVSFRGARVTLYFGHRKLIETEDTTFASAGKAGLWTKADTEAYFDNFRIDKKD